jgi:glycosyltransferase involved in cell wall biosynthesis
MEYGAADEGLSLFGFEQRVFESGRRERLELRERKGPEAFIWNVCVPIVLATERHGFGGRARYTSRVRVAIDMRRIGAFGVGTYVRNVVRALAHIDTETEYLLIGGGERLREFGDLPPNFVPVAFEHESPSPRYYLEFRSLVRKGGCDLVHVPYMFWRPLMAPCPYVVTVHDLLAFLHRDEMNANGLSRDVQAWLTRRAVRNAARILAVSSFTRDELVRLHGVPVTRIEVVYNAIDDRLARGHATDADREMIAERYQVNYPFLLYAGNIRPHKNVVRIIEAFSALKTELEKDGALPDLKLIIIGDELSKHPDLRRTVVRSGVQNDVRFLGFLPIDVLRIFYDAAKVFVFPSLYEGFGLPPLEAMAHGTPVVTSNISSLPEVVGDAAVLVNPENVFEIMRALHRVLLDQQLRERMKQRGYAQAQRFSWEVSARRILKVYREIAQ